MNVNFGLPVASSSNSHYEPEQLSHLETLPIEIFLRVAEHLNAKEIGSLYCSSTSLKNIIDTNKESIFNFRLFQIENIPNKHEKSQAFKDLLMSLISGPKVVNVDQKVIKERTLMVMEAIKKAGINNVFFYELCQILKKEGMLGEAFVFAEFLSEEFRDQMYISILKVLPEKNPSYDFKNSIRLHTILEGIFPNQRFDSSGSMKTLGESKEEILRAMVRVNQIQDALNSSLESQNDEEKYLGYFIVVGELAALGRFEEAESIANDGKVRLDSISDPARGRRMLLSCINSYKEGSRQWEVNPRIEYSGVTRSFDSSAGKMWRGANMPIKGLLNMNFVNAMHGLSAVEG